MSLPIIPGPNNQLITASAVPTYPSMGTSNYAQYTQGKVSIGTGASFPAIIVSGSISTTGNPVLIMCSGDAAPDPAGGGEIQLYRGSTALGQPIVFDSSFGSENNPYNISCVDAPNSGIHTYYLKVLSLSANTDFGENNGPNLILIELGRV